MGLCHVHGVQRNRFCICSATSFEEQLAAVISAAGETRQVVDQQDCRLSKLASEGPGDRWVSARARPLLLSWETWGCVTHLSSPRKGRDPADQTQLLCQ